MSLDIFRGLTIFLMIVVNCSGPGSFAQLQHSEWNGWTLTDLVFPFFLFITGVSLTFSFASRLNAPRSNAAPAAGNPSRLRLLPHILRRSAIIFAIGLLINGFPYYHLATWRIAGVLQRIALCYLAASVLYLWTGARTRWAIIAALLVGYWLLMRFVPVPGFGIPTVDIPLLDPDRNLVAWLDRHLMMGRLYEQTRDPEGLLSTFPAIANTLFGVAAGEWIRNLRADSAKLLRRLVAAGLALLRRRRALGPHLPHQQKALDQLLRAPHRRPRHACARRLLLAAGRKETAWPLDHRPPGLRDQLHLRLRILRIRRHLPPSSSSFTSTVNPVSCKEALNSFTFDNISQPQWSQLGYALFYAAFCWFFTWLLYRRKIFLKI